MNRTLLRATQGVVVVPAAALAFSAVQARETELSLRATAMNTSNVGRPGLQSLDILVERWSTDQELATLRDALIEKGADGLTRELQDIKPRAGSIRVATGGIGWDIRFAHRTELPGGGYRLIILTDRPMSFWETLNRPRSAEYDLLAAQIQMGADGKGEGKLVPAARISYNKSSHTIEVENYANEPVRLTEVREDR